MLRPVEQLSHSMFRPVEQVPMNVKTSWTIYIECLHQFRKSHSMFRPVEQVTLNV